MLIVSSVYQLDVSVHWSRDIILGWRVALMYWVHSVAGGQQEECDGPVQCHGQCWLHDRGTYAHHVQEHGQQSR